MRQADGFEQLAHQRAREQQEADRRQRTHAALESGRGTRGREDDQEDGSERERLGEARRDTTLAALGGVCSKAHGRASSGRGSIEGRSGPPAPSSPARSSERLSAIGPTSSPASTPAAATTSTLCAAGLSNPRAIETAHASVMSPVEARPNATSGPAGRAGRDRIHSKVPRTSSPRKRDSTASGKSQLSAGASLGLSSAPASTASGNS